MSSGKKNNDTENRAVVKINKIIYIISVRLRDIQLLLVYHICDIIGNVRHVTRNAV